MQLWVQIPISSPTCISNLGRNVQKCNAHLHPHASDDGERPVVSGVELRSDAKEGMNETALPHHIALPHPSHCGSCEKALSVFDTRNRFVTSLLNELPFGKGKRFLNAGGIVNESAWRSQIL
jgi:hypothetical protein